MHKINRNYIKLYILLHIPNIIIKFYPNIASSKTQRHSTLTQTFPDSPFMDMDDVMHTYNSKGYHGTGCMSFKGDKNILQVLFLLCGKGGGGRKSSKQNNNKIRYETTTTTTTKLEGTMDGLLFLGGEGRWGVEGWQHWCSFTLSWDERTS